MSCVITKRSRCWTAAEVNTAQAKATDAYSMMMLSRFSLLNSHTHTYSNCVRLRKLHSCALLASPSTTAAHDAAVSCHLLLATPSLRLCRRTSPCCECRM